MIPAFRLVSKWLNAIKLEHQWVFRRNHQFAVDIWRGYLRFERTRNSINITRFYRFPAGFSNVNFSAPIPDSSSVELQSNCRLLENDVSGIFKTQPNEAAETMKMAQTWSVPECLRNDILHVKRAKVGLPDYPISI
jgi:hypothetical protein